MKFEDIIRKLDEHNDELLETIADYVVTVDDLNYRIELLEQTIEDLQED